MDAKPPPLFPKGDIMADAALTKEEQDASTPEYKHRKKLLEQEKKRKASNRVEKEWYELTPNKLSKKGGKVALVQKMKNGTVYRTLVGHEKQCAELIAKAKKDGALKLAGT